eukprot:scaffold24385_cov50-Phaeocystis_antarctica.AAC.3
MSDLPGVREGKYIEERAGRTVAYNYGTYVRCHLLVPRSPPPPTSAPPALPPAAAAPASCSTKRWVPPKRRTAQWE